MIDNEKLWQTALGEFEVSLSKGNYTTWFRGSFIYKIDDHLATIGVFNNFSLEWLRKKFHQQIIDTLNKLTKGQVTEVEYMVASKDEQPKHINSSPLINNPVDKKATPVNPTLTPLSKPQLNAKYTFDHYIVGNSNRMAHAAAEAVADNPGHAYNPLFIWGGVGLGKTHLIQAIAHRVLQKDSNKKVVYTTSEQFTNSFVDSLRKGKANEFKHLYRGVDVLIIDDIQFIAGKEAVQEEFFHTFNALHQQNSQIIITSDRIPKAIPTLEDRLSSRFEMGLIVDINLPDVETRTAIIKSACEEKGFEITDEIVNYLAVRISRNIREIEGAVNRLVAYCGLSNIEPTEALIESTLQQYLNNEETKQVTANKIIKMVASFYNITVDQILGQRRTKDLVHPRQVAMHLLRSELNISLPNVGKEMGGKDHTTVMYACNKIEKELLKNNTLQQEIATLKERLYSV
ncbi:MAG: chromosomal replication initiator protein DnaA [Patescibacteria group bacterium]|jgi:chromosomal replication initiator protein